MQLAHFIQLVLTLMFPSFKTTQSIYIKKIEETSGHSISMHKTGGYYLASNQNWHDYLKRERSNARSLGLDQEFVTLDEVVDKHPLIDPKHYVAALWDPSDGDIDPSGVVYAYAKSARVHGAEFYTHTPVIETNQRLMVLGTLLQRRAISMQSIL